MLMVNVHHRFLVVAVAAVGLLVAAAAAIPSPQAPQTIAAARLRPPFFVQPTDYVRASSLAVPTGKTLIVTGVGRGIGGSLIDLRINGVTQMTVQPDQSDLTLVATPAGVFGREGDIVAVTSGYFIGYLALNGFSYSVDIKPDPTQLVSIDNSQVPYTVPAGKVLVLTSVGSMLCCPLRDVGLNIGGNPMLEVKQPCSRPQSLVELPVGFVLQAGEIITFTMAGSTPCTDPIARGYLADA